MKICILGSDWTIEHAPQRELEEKGCDGYTDNTVRKIVVASFEPDARSKQDLDRHARKVLRHEIVHAFLYESGLAENSDWAMDEEMVDWIAMQFPKLMVAFAAAGAMD